MPRFFRRLAEGVFDPVEVRHRADELARFVRDARDAYALPPPVAVGYSNGANIAAVLLARHPGTLAGAALIRPMDVLDDPPRPGPAVPVLILSGALDGMAPAGQADRLAARLRRAGALVQQESLPTGHGLSQQDVRHVTEWLAEAAIAVPA